MNPAPVSALSLPLLYSGLLDLTGRYGIGFVACGLPALFVGVQLLRQQRIAVDPVVLGHREKVVRRGPLSLSDGRSASAA